MLTGESSPAADVAGSAMRQVHAGVGQAGGHDGVGEGDGGGQLDQGDVITGKINIKKAFACVFQPLGLQLDIAKIIF